MRKILLLTVVVLWSASYARAQSTCTQTLRLAQSIYDQGRLHELPELLNTCLEENGFNTEEKVSAYKLLILTYIYLEEPAKADDYMLALLSTNTEFKVNDAVDPAEFVALYNTFRTRPIYRLGGKLGGVATGPTVVSSDYADDGTNNPSHNYGFSGTVSAEIPIGGKFRKFAVNPEINFQLLSFKGVNEQADTARRTPATERQSWISLPVSLQYAFYERPLTTYYVSTGISADYMLSSKKTIISNRDGNSAIDENSIAVNEQRNKFNAAAIASAGLKRKIGKGYFLVELRYKMGLIPISDPADTYDNSVLVFDYKYVDGIYKLHTLTLSAGYVMNRYNPKKLTSR